MPRSTTLLLSASILLCAPILLGACAVEPDDEPSFRGVELEASSGEPMCSDPSQLVPGEETKLYTVISADVVELHDGVEATTDPKTGVMYLANGLLGIECRCNGGCNEIIPCSSSGDGPTKTCSGDCVGTDSDGQTCGGCTWHLVDVPSPTGTPGGLDPTGNDTGKPPGIDPTAGEIDPTFGGPYLPPFDPPPGELDPTR